MNGIEKITARIESDASADVEAIRAEAEAKCQEIRAAYDQKAQDAYWAIVKAGAEECEQRVLRASRTAGMESKKTVLAMKQDMVSQAFDMAMEKLLSMPEKRYVDFLAKQAAAAARKGTERVALNAADLEKVGPQVVKAANALLDGGKLTLAKKPVGIRGGLILQDGDIQINCSIEQLMEQYRGHLAAQVAEVLFEA